MLFVIDVGNTNVVLGVFDGKKLIAHWRLSSQHKQTVDEWGILTRNLFSYEKIDPLDIDGLIISSVVPPLDTVLEKMASRYFNLTAHFVRPESQTKMAVRYEQPQDVGPDRIVNGVAAFENYGGPCIIVDFGTATTFDAVSASGEYMGGVIAPGIGIAAEALYLKTARLPRVDIREPQRVIGRDTVSSIQSGLYYGYLSLVDGILERMVKEISPATRVIATGGYAELLAKGSKYIQHINPILMLEGLRLMWEHRRAGGR